MRYPSLALAIALLAAPACAAQTTLVLPPVGQDAWLIPSNHSPVLYGATDPTDNYGIAQWGNPNGDLGNFASISCTGSFASFTNCLQATSENITVTSYVGTDSNRWIDFQTTGVNGICPNEMDSLHTAMSSVYPTYPQAAIGQANITQINHLYAAFKAYPVAFATVDMNCGTIAQTMLMEVGFTNPTMGETLFYQLNLYKWPSPAGAGFFANTNPYGYRDVMANYGQSPLTVGVVSDFTGGNALDLAARVCAVIQGATNGMDTNCADWYSNGIYHGGQTFGDTTGEYAFCCFTLTATSKPVPRPLRWHG